MLSRPKSLHTSGKINEFNLFLQRKENEAGPKQSYWFVNMRRPTCKLIEVISDIEGLVVVISILIVDELHAPWWWNRG